MIAYKSLASGGVGVYSGFRWPTPANGGPGPWVEVDGPLVFARNAIHAIPLERLTDWIDDELWVIELGGELGEHEGVFLASRGRLVERIAAWTPASARSFAWDCVLSAREAAVGALERAGSSDEAGRLAGAEDADLMSVAAAILRATDGPAATAVAFVADAVALFHGERPERYDAHPGAALVAGVGVIAANLGYVVSQAVGAMRADERGPAAFDDGVRSERDRQHRWLVERLGLVEA